MRPSLPVSDRRRERIKNGLSYCRANIDLFSACQSSAIDQMRRRLHSSKKINERTPQYFFSSTNFCIESGRIKSPSPRHPIQVNAESLQSIPMDRGIQAVSYFDANIYFVYYYLTSVCEIVDRIGRPGAEHGRPPTFSATAKGMGSDPNLDGFCRCFAREVGRVAGENCRRKVGTKRTKNFEYKFTESVAKLSIFCLFSLRLSGSAVLNAQRMYGLGPIDLAPVFLLYYLLY